MTDLTFAPFTIVAVLVSLIVTDVIMGTWSIWTTLEMVGVLFFIGLYLYGSYGPQPPTETLEELRARNFEVWERFYFRHDWNGFWELLEES